MTLVTFNSQTHADSCGRYLADLSSAAPGDGDPCSQVVVVTGTGRVSVARRLLQLLSPLVREAVSRMVELVLTGRTSVDTSGVQLNDELSLF